MQRTTRKVAVLLVNHIPIINIHVTDINHLRNINVNRHINYFPRWNWNSLLLSER